MNSPSLATRALVINRKCVSWLSVVVCVLAISSLVGARYLPTRADETDVEILKDIIRGLIAQSNLAQAQVRLDNKLQNADNYYKFNELPTRLALERRALEIPNHSDGDHHLASLLQGGSTGPAN